MTTARQIPASEIHRAHAVSIRMIALRWVDSSLFAGACATSLVQVPIAHTARGEAANAMMRFRSAAPRRRRPGSCSAFG